MNKEQSSQEEESSPLKPNATAPNKDQIVTVIGEKGMWQFEKSLIVFLVSIPGLAHIFLTPFLFPKMSQQVEYIVCQRIWMLNILSKLYI